MTTRKKKSAREKRVLVASIIVAATIVAGSTFAWFTSKDEVTNRLTAKADYGVSITEDFTPPEDWTPGQKINKDVSAVNTGNIDAFVRLGLMYDSKLTVGGEGEEVPPTAPAEAARAKWIELKKESNAQDETANEVTLLQAGGTLVYAAGELDNSQASNVSAGDDTGTHTDYAGPDQFKPKKTGLYLFRRAVYETDNDSSASNTAVTKYSGYYYVAASGEDLGGQGKYYALVTEPGTVYTAGIDSNAFTINEAGKVTMTANALNNVKIANTTDVVISNVEGTNKFVVEWIKDDGTPAEQDDKSDAKNIRLTYAGTDGNTDDDNVIIDIELADNWTEKWAYIDAKKAPKVDGTNDTGYFFYKGILKAGATTEKLVDSVTLNKDVTQKAYKDLTFDLSVVLDSVQITPDEAKTNDSYVIGVNDSDWGATAAKNGETITWTKSGT